MKKWRKILLCFLLSTPIVNAKEIEVGFSTTGTALDIILNAIHQAKRDIHVSAYIFTSKPVSLALLEAKKRGVNIKILADKKANGNKYSAVTFLKNHQIETCLTDYYAIMHNKFMVIDTNTVQTGSFNYSTNAAKRNAENVIVINNKDVANAYEQEFNRLYNECVMG